MQALRIAATGMHAQQTRVEVISNNIANMSTNAYSARRAEFSDLHYQQIREPGSITSATGAIAPSGVELGLGVKAASISMNVEQGALRQTGGDLDLAIEGRGYFEVTLPSGQSAFTRDGGLKRTGDGLIVNSDGFAIGGDITIPQDARSIAVNADGEVYAFFDDDPAGQLLGTLTLSLFVNEKGLKSLGGNLFGETEASGSPIAGQPGLDGRGTVQQGFLEDSSVDVVKQIADLIEAQRGYELNSKVITAVDQMLSSTTQIR